MPFTSAYHAPVLVDEVLELFRGAGCVLDCTLGGGGHSLALLEQGVGAVVGIDRDPEALRAARERLLPLVEAGRLATMEASYADGATIPDIRYARIEGVLLELALPMLRDRLSPSGVLAVIAYHSGEDRLVKNAFREWSAACICPPKQPVCTCRGRPLGTTLTRRAVTATDEEVARNPRARSA